MPETSEKEKDKALRPRKPMSLLLRVSLWTAIILHILIVLFFRMSSDDLPDHSSAKPYVTFVSNDSFAKDVELEEYAMLFDSSPLFIPTRWNASQLFEVDFENMSLSQLSEFEPAIELLDTLQPDGFLATRADRVNKPSDLLTSRFWRFFEGFGRSAETPLPFEQTQPIAEVFVMAPSQKTMEPIIVDLEPAVSFSVARPVSYTLRRSTGGLVWGTPMLVETSGNQAFDQAIARWLQRPDILAQLPVGYLRIRVFFW